jgi:UDP-N-acetylmuramoylalanine-D-glutamate ligase
MSINKTYAVFGLGRYGLSVAKELVNNGAEVIAVDLDENIEGIKQEEPKNEDNNLNEENGDNEGSNGDFDDDFDFSDFFDDADI